MKKILKLTLSLFLVCLAAALCLAYVNSITKDKIAASAAQKQNEALAAMFQDCDTFEALSEENLAQLRKESGVNPENSILLFKCSKGIALKGYAAECRAKGFGGDIVFFVGFDTAGNTLGVNLLSHSETPGLGSKVGEEEFISQFVRQASSSQYTLIKGDASEEGEVSAVSGATISSKAVVAGVNDAKALVLKLIEKGQE